MSDTTIAKCHACGQEMHGTDYITQIREDAERYRWLKANHLQTGRDSWIRTGDDLEEAIDAAMRAEK